jgi:hypothetical protein
MSMYVCHNTSSRLSRHCTTVCYLTCNHDQGAPVISTACSSPLLLNLPVDGRHAGLSQQFVRLGEVLAAEEALVRAEPAAHHA